MKDGNGSFYLVSLIEHKSSVDYNVVMQVLRYIVFIWEDYEREMNRKQEGISRTKGFRYPPVLPVIFYDGSENWTAATMLHDRVLLTDMLGKYIPNYQCIIVQLKDYSNQELMEKKDELSIIMMLDKLKNAAEFASLGQETDKKYLDEIVTGSPGYLLEIMSQIVEILLSRLNVPEKEVIKFTNLIKERRMGELFANFKGYDVQAARQEAREEGHREGVEEGRREGMKEGIEKGIKELICSLKKLHAADEIIKEQLTEGFGLSMKEAEKAVKEYMQP